jgi:hypothetical protein
MYDENKLLFKVEHARRTLRGIEGKAGGAEKAAITNPELTKYYMDEARPKNPYNIPESDEESYEPYIITGHKRVGIINDIHLPYHSIEALTATLIF